MKGYAGKTLMLVENPFPWDKRVYNEACTLTNAGYDVTVIALRKNGERFREDVNGIHVYRIPKVTLFKKIFKTNSSFLQKIIQRFESVIGYMGEYFYFTFSCLLLSFYILIKDGFDIIHAHNPPDTLFLIGGVFKLFGKRFIFDHHDLSPELYLSRFETNSNIVYRALIIIEKLSLRLADIVIATNESYKEIEVLRGKIKCENVFVVRNGPDLNRVRLVPPDEKLKMMRKNILGYVGVMCPQDGVDYLLRSLRILLYDLKRNDFFCVIIGSGDSISDLKSMSSKLKIEDHVWFTGFIPDEDVLRYLSTADICVDPDPSSPLNNVSTWIKIMEYMTLGKPIVSFELKETRYTAQEAAIYVPPNDEKEFARAIMRLMDDPLIRERMGTFGRRRIKEELAWHHISKNLLLAYESIFRVM